MAEEKHTSTSSPSLADEQLPGEAGYHSIDVFGHEEDHDVCPFFHFYLGFPLR